MASRPFQFLEKNAPKSERERPSTLKDLPPYPPIQRDGGRRSRPGVNPFISALTVARCPATFPGVWPQLRDTLSTSRRVGMVWYLYLSKPSASHFDIAWKETFSLSASCCWVSPRVLRFCIIKLPILAPSSI